MIIEVAMDPRLAEALKALASDGRAETALQELAERVADGVYRPGSWERQWLMQVFPVEHWTHRLEGDPDCPWRVRVRPNRGHGS